VSRPWEPLNKSGRVGLRREIRPIKAHELSHSGAMAQLMQRRASVFHAQDSRSRLVQRLPGSLGHEASPSCSALALLIMLPGLCLGSEPAVPPDSAGNRTSTASASEVAAEDTLVPAALFEFIGEFSDADTDWTDPTELDDWMLQSARTAENQINQSSIGIEQEPEPDEH